jgi:hypothetical protein
VGAPLLEELRLIPVGPENVDGLPEETVPTGAVGEVAFPIE